MAVKFLIPFDENGNHHTYMYYRLQEFSKDSSYEFEDTLTYKGFERGRSSLNIVWVDSKGKEYRSSMSTLSLHLQQGGGNQISGRFGFKKRGTSVLLEKI